MAGGKSYLSKYTHRFIPGEKEQQERQQRSSSITPEPMFEFDEGELSNKGSSTTDLRTKRVVPSYKKTLKKSDGDNGVARSMAMKIPEWRKIGIKEDSEDKDSCRRMNEEDYEDEEERIPPHEYLARRVERSKIGSFSVHEGRGRTLKGRDLSRVRDAIWKQTGFQD